MWPVVGCSNPAIKRKRVVFPQPDGPSKQINLPWGNSRFTLLTAAKFPKDLPNSSSRRLDIWQCSLMAERDAVVCTARLRVSACASLAGNHLGPFLVQPIRFLCVKIITRDDRRYVARHGGEFLLRQIKQFALHCGRRSDIA